MLFLSWFYKIISYHQEVSAMNHIKQFLKFTVLYMYLNSYKQQNEETGSGWAKAFLSVSLSQNRLASQTVLTLQVQPPFYHTYI